MKKKSSNSNNKYSDITKEINQLAVKKDSLEKFIVEIISKKGKYAAFEYNGLERSCPEIEFTISQKDELSAYWRKKIIDEMVKRAGEKHRVFFAKYTKYCKLINLIKHKKYIIFYMFIFNFNCLM